MNTAEEIKKIKQELRLSMNGVASAFMRENGLKYDPSEILVSNGAKQSLFNVFQALINVCYSLSNLFILRSRKSG